MSIAMRAWRALTLISSFCAVLGACSDGRLQPRGASVTFTLHQIDQIGTQLGQTALADLDRDGDLDYIAGQAKGSGGNVWWWEFRAANDWVRHDIGQGNTDVGGAAHDVNGDGWTDFLAGAALLLHTGDPTAPFTPHNPGALYSHDTEFADIDGDGRLDALANSDKTGLFWYTIPGDPTQPWTRHTIATIDEHKVHGGISPRGFGDLDGDGDTDVVTAQIWYENADGAGTAWTPHKALDFGREDKYGVAVRTWVGDLDADGDNDIVQAEADHSDSRVAWFENDGSAQFARHIIREAGQNQDFHALAVADFNNDGTLDVASGTAPLTANKNYGVYVWLQTPGGWAEHKIASVPGHELVAGDVDADGDIDICAKPWRESSDHYFLENHAADTQ